MSAMVAILLLGVTVLTACGGGSDNPDPTKTVPSVVDVVPATPAVETSLNSTQSTPAPLPTVSESPVAATSLLTPLTREQAQQQVLQTFPMTQAPAKGGTVLIGESGDISTVNGMLTIDQPTIYVTGAIFEPLLGASPIDGRPVPGLADTWDVSEDGLTYTFYLNTEARWHDGVDFTANDVKFSFDAALDPNTGFAGRSILAQNIADYRVVDEDTFEMTAEGRFVTFLYQGPGGVFIMPEHIWSSVGVEAWSFDSGSTGQDPARVVGTGPFKFKEWVQGDHVTIVRNDDYYDVIPNIDAMTIQVLPNADASVLALVNDQIDVMEILPPEQTETVRNTAGFNVDIYELFGFTAWLYNLDSAITPLFQDKAVRQAMFYAIDRDLITDEIFLGYGEVAKGTQPPPSPAYAPDQMTPDYAYNPEKALELMAQAGWTDSDDDGTLDRDGEDFKFKLTYSGGDATVEKIVAELQEKWKQIGIEMELNSVAGAALLEALDTHEFDLVLLAPGLSQDGSQTIYFACSSISSGFNFMSYCNDEWDQLDTEQKEEFDPASRNQLLIEQSQLVWEELPVGILRFGVARTGYTDRMHNFYPNAYGFLWSLPYVWIEQ